MSMVQTQTKKEHFPLLRMLLGKEGYERFKEQVLVKALDDTDSTLPKESLEKLKLGLRLGGELPTHEELLHYRSATARDGGALLKVSIDLPDLQLSNFVKIHHDKKRAKREITLTGILSDEAKASHILPLRYADEKHGILATPFITGQTASDAYHMANDEGKAQILHRCLDALLDTYAQAMHDNVRKSANKLVQTDQEHYADRLQQRILNRIAGSAIKAERLKGAYARDIHEALKDEPLILLHGDPHLNNFILDKDKANLIDLERMRYGTIHTDLHKLFLRANPDEKTKGELLDKAHAWAQQHGLAKEKETFLKAYHRAEINELLFTAADLVDASQSAPKEHQKTLQTAANLYYTKAIAAARSQQLEELAEGLAAITPALKNVTVIPESDYPSAEDSAGLHVHGLSTLYDHSIPEERARLVEDVRTSIQRKARKRFFTRLGLAAAGLLAAAGFATAIAHFGKSKQDQPPSENVAYNDLSDYVRMDYPEREDGLSDAIETHPSAKPFTHDTFYWVFLTLDHNDQMLRQQLAIPYDTYKRLMTGEYARDKDNVVVGRGLVATAAVRYGIPTQLAEAVFWTNILKAPYRNTDNRDPITLLPKEVMDQFERQSRDNRSVEERVDLAVRYLRDRLEKNQLNAPRAIAEYYLGSDSANEAIGKARSQHLHSPENFWTYCQFLPEGNELVRHAVVAYKDINDDAYSDFGYWSSTMQRNINIDDAYRKTRPTSDKK